MNTDSRADVQPVRSRRPVLLQVAPDLVRPATTMTTGLLATSTIVHSGGLGLVRCLVRHRHAGVPG